MISDGKIIVEESVIEEHNLDDTQRHKFDGETFSYEDSYIKNKVQSIKNYDEKKPIKGDNIDEKIYAQNQEPEKIGSDANVKLIPDEEPEELSDAEKQEDAIDAAEVLLQQEPESDNVESTIEADTDALENKEEVEEVATEVQVAADLAESNELKFNPFEAAVPKESDLHSIDDNEEFEYNLDTFTTDYNDVPNGSFVEINYEKLDLSKEAEIDSFVVVDHVDQNCLESEIDDIKIDVQDVAVNPVQSSSDSLNAPEMLQLAIVKPVHTASSVKQRPSSSSPTRERVGNVFDHLYSLSSPRQEKGKVIRENIERKMEEENKSSYAYMNNLQMHRQRNTSSRDGFEKTFNERGRKITLEQAEQLYNRFMAHKDRVEKKLQALRKERDDRQMDFIMNKKISPEVFERLYKAETFSTSVAKSIATKSSHTMPMTPMSVDSTLIETQELIQEAEKYDDLYD